MLLLFFSETFMHANALPGQLFQRFFDIKVRVLNLNRQDQWRRRL